MQHTVIQECGRKVMSFIWKGGKGVVFAETHRLRHEMMALNSGIESYHPRWVIQMPPCVGDALFFLHTTLCVPNLNPFAAQGKGESTTECCFFGRERNIHVSTDVLLTQDERSRLPRLHNRLYCYFPAYQRLIWLENMAKKHISGNRFSRCEARDD